MEEHKSEARLPRINGNKTGNKINIMSGDKNGNVVIQQEYNNKLSGDNSGVRSTAAFRFASRSSASVWMRSQVALIDADRAVMASIPP